VAGDLGRQHRDRRHAHLGRSNQPAAGAASSDHARGGGAERHREATHYSPLHADLNYYLENLIQQWVSKLASIYRARPKIFTEQRSRRGGGPNGASWWVLPAPPTSMLTARPPPPDLGFPPHANTSNHSSLHLQRRRHPQITAAAEGPATRGVLPAARAPLRP
jgi:hypothetical protein